MAKILTVEVMPHNTTPRLELSLPKIVAGALAAASAAVASSWLGVAGTLVGAVVVSVVATVGTALYSHSLERSQHAIKETIPVLATRGRLDRDPADGPETLEFSAATATAGPDRRSIDWATVVVSCLATLGLGFGALTGFEALVGKSAADLTGTGSHDGTTLGSLVGGGPGGGKGAGGSTSPSRPSTTPKTSPTPTTPAPTSPATTEPTSPTATRPTPTAPTSPTTTGPTSTGPTSTGPSSTGPTSPPTTGPAR